MLLFVYDGGETSITLALLFEKYRLILLKYAYRILKSQQDAEDCVASTFELLARQMEQSPDCIDDINSRRTGSFLFTITRNQAYSIFRKKRKLVFLEDTGSLEELNGSSERDPHLDDFILHEARGIIYNAVASLDDKYRDPLILRYYHDCSVAQIAQLLNVSENHASVLIRRAKVKVKKALAEYA